MASVGEVSVLFTGNDAKLQAVSAHAQKTVTRFASTARTALATAGAALGFIGVTAALRSFVRAAAEQEVAEKKLSTALGRTSKVLLDQATALQKVTTASDDQIISIQASLAAFTKDEDRIKALTKASLDFAAATGGDAVSAGQLLAKTLGSDLNALSRYGVSVKGAANSTERFNQIVEGIARLFGGQAQAATTTFSGRVSVLKNKFGDVAEDLGRKLIPALERLLVTLDENSDRIGKLGAAVIDGTAKYGGYAIAVIAVSKVLKLLDVSILSSLAKFLSLSTALTGTLVLAFVAAGASVANLIDFFTTGTAATDKFVDAIFRLGRNPLQGLSEQIHAVNLQLEQAGRDLADAKGLQEQLTIREKITALSERQLGLAVQWAKIAKDQGASLEDQADNAANIAKGEAAVTEMRKKQAAIQAKVSVSKSPAAEAFRTHGSIVDKTTKAITTGFDKARAASSKLFTEMVDGLKEFADARADLLGKVRMFGVEGLDAAIGNIKQQRDELAKEAVKLGLGGTIPDINARAAKQITAATKEAGQAFADKLGGFGGDEKQNQQAAIQSVIRERDALIEEARGLGLLTDAMRAQINARAEQAAVGTVQPRKTPEFIGLQEAFGRMQKSIFEGEAQKEAAMIAKQQLKAAEEAAKVRDAISAAGQRAADGIMRLIQLAGNGRGVFD